MWDAEKEKGPGLGLRFPQLWRWRRGENLATASIHERLGAALKPRGINISVLLKVKRIEV